MFILLYFVIVSITFTEILRDDDYNVSFMTPIESDDSYVLKYSDFVDVKCESKNRNE